jgi:multiple sugar transport system ATP-binding protein
MAKYDSIPAEVILGIRPEDIHQVEAASGNASYDIEVKVAELLGHEYYIHTDFGGADMISKFSADVGHEVKLHSTKSVAFDLNKIHFFDPTSEYRILTKEEK